MCGVSAWMWVPETRRTSGDLLILVDEAAEAVAPCDLAARRLCGREWACRSTLVPGLGAADDRCSGV